ncbi:MAG: hypothetical protein EOO77_08535 [Oxalobacteraceae bacterium]|nr:MAG: hypothetical protein EOO77_08535 [Oxalobacteraceae bacterium]
MWFEVIASGKAAEMPQAAEEASLDLIAMLVGTDIVRDGDLAVPLGRDHRLSLCGGDPGTSPLPSYALSARTAFACWSSSRAEAETSCWHVLV